MSIMKKVLEKKLENQQDHDKANLNREKAVAAIQAGIRSKAWKKYMSQFAETPLELMRLMGTDGTLGDETLDIKRAYLVANAVCGSGTTTDLDREVDTIDH